ncbi:MAG: dihydrolipoyl dehydrogenase [Actinobacteria bacterium]|nr:dihydrolipoyl dehydrogenase [Actinomycetota bacterium]MDI6830038.1 dihydrolipoyl dehydrogenase [Actinomycetota bacterium]
MAAETKKAKLVVIGAGPGGYVAAIRAAQLGDGVVLVEKNLLGGTCLNWGCIPTKALLACAEALETIKEAGEYGIKVSEPVPDLKAMVERKEKISAQLRNGIAQLLKANKVEVVKGTASLASPNLVKVRGEEGELEIETEKVIIATGSEPARLPTFDFDQPAILTSTEGLELTEIPKSMIIVGSGVVGSEFATIYNALGTKVTMVELMPRILPTEDERVAQQMKRILNKKGIEILTETTIEEMVEYRPDGVKARLSNGEVLEAEKLLVSIGRSLNSRGLGLEEIGVELGQRGEIVVNERMETSVPGIYAIGDVVGGILLAHVASFEGICAAENAMGLSSTMDYNVVPACIFTEPEIASVGLTPAKAEEKGIETRIGRFMFGGLGKALAMGKGQGFVQLVVDAKSDKVIGCQIMSAHASDLIHEIALAIQVGVTADQIGKTIHAHPSLAEAVMEAAEAAHDRAIHAAPARK